MNALDTFKSPKAPEYLCQVEAYTSSHSMLLIRIDPETHPVKYIPAEYLLFSFVLFFNGPKLWQGVDFQVASSEMTLEFVRSHGAFDYIKDDEIIEHYKLYHLEKPRLLVQIVAERVAQSDQRPHYAYRYLTDE